MNAINTEIENSVLKTGTTILGIVCKDGIIMAADRQTTAGNIVMNKNKQKVRKINDYIVSSWTGGVADAQMLSKVVAAELRLKELRVKKRPTVKEAANLFANMSYRNIRQPTMLPHIVGTLVGGVNDDGSVELFSVEPAGGIVKVEDYDANFGSGMPYVLGFLERLFNPEMTVKEGVKLAIEALKASTERDTGSGHGIDIFVITKDGIKHEVAKKLVAELK